MFTVSLNVFGSLYLFQAAHQEIAVQFKQGNV